MIHPHTSTVIKHLYFLSSFATLIPSTMLSVNDEMEVYMRAMVQVQGTLTALFQSLVEGRVYLVTIPKRETITMYENERECDDDFRRISSSGELNIPLPDNKGSANESIQFYGRFDGFGSRVHQNTMAHVLRQASEWTCPTSMLPGLIFTLVKDTETRMFGATVILNRGQFHCESYFAATFQPAVVRIMAHVVECPPTNSVVFPEEDTPINKKIN